LLVLLVASSDAPSTLDAVCGLAAASAGRGHEVTVFFHMDGVKLLNVSLRTGRLVHLLPLGVRLLACRTSARERGVEGDLVEGAEMSSLGELVELMERCDRALFLD